MPVRGRPRGLLQSRMQCFVSFVAKRLRIHQGEGLCLSYDPGRWKAAPVEGAIPATAPPARVRQESRRKRRGHGTDPATWVVLVNEHDEAPALPEEERGPSGAGFKRRRTFGTNQAFWEAALASSAAMSARTLSMSRSRIWRMRSSRAEDGRAPDWRKIAMPSRNAMSVGIELICAA